MRERNILVLGAVAYDPKVVTIWEGFKRYFESKGLRFDAVLYLNYERQVADLLGGHIDVAWNSPLAWLQAERVAALRRQRALAIAMRDSDQDLRSVVVVRDSGPVQTIADLKGRSVAVGAADSPQATLIPLLLLAEEGIEPGRDFEVRYCDLLAGKHGDHIGGEREAARALMAGKIDAACMIDSNYAAFTQDGTLNKGATRILTTTGAYDHCNFSVLEGVESLESSEETPVGIFRKLLLEMSWTDPEVRPLLDMEGLKAWRPGRVDGYALLERAVERFGTLGEFISRMEQGSISSKDRS